jgi:thymidylate synthase
MAIPVISARTRATTWADATRFLRARPRWEAYNVLLEIAEPWDDDPESERIESTVDKFLRSNDVGGLHTVAETIFPGWLYRKYGADGVYEIYPDQVYPEIKPHPQITWGTYAYRLVRRHRPGKSVINPLKQCVDKMRSEIAGSRRRCCYELTTYDPIADGGRRLGGPCLSHVSLKIGPNDVILLTALYRNHYYIERTLGNLLGLARLQQFVADQVGLKPGPLVCHSTFAKLDHDHWSKTAVAGLLESCEVGR